VKLIGRAEILCKLTALPYYAIKFRLFDRWDVDWEEGFRRFRSLGNPMPIRFSASKKYVKSISAHAAKSHLLEDLQETCGELCGRIRLRACRFIQAVQNDEAPAVCRELRELADEIDDLRTPASAKRLGHSRWPSE